MTGQLITLPVRLGLQGTRLMFRVAEGVTDLAVGTTLRVAGAVLGARPQRRAEPSTPPAASASFRPVRDEHERSPEPGAPTTSGRVAARGNGAGELASRRLEREGVTTTLPRPASEPEPEHVSPEPELVLESAEPGAEEGAGATVEVREPWEGYGGMNARAVISRLAQATAAELAAIQLYESAHRSRRTVLQAVERELRTKSSGR
jgi:hypothetical protein